MNYEEIKKLIDDMGNAKIDELEIEFPEGMKISMKKNTEKEVVVANNMQEQMQSVHMSTSTPTIQVNTENNNNILKEQPNYEENYKIIKSPMVGTFYSKPSPNANSYVEIGQKVKKGDVLCIVEAMKLMNEIESEFDGEITEILVQDGEAVEYGKPLFKIKK